MLDTTIHKTQDEDKQNQKNTTQYMLDTTIHKTQDEDKQNKKHNTICVGHHHTQDTEQRQIQCTRHRTKTNNAQDTEQRQTMHNPATQDNSELSTKHRTKKTDREIKNGQSSDSRQQ